MTASREGLRRLISNTKKAVAEKRIFAEAIVTDFSYVDSYVRVKILPENLETWCRYAYSKASENNIVGGMPDIGTRLLVIFPNYGLHQYENIIALPIELFYKGLTKPDKEPNSSDDKLYYSINPKNGGKISFYKDNDDLDVLFINALGKIEVSALDDLNINVHGTTTIECDRINLGKPSLSDSPANALVKQPHLAKYDSLVDAINTAFTALAFIDALFGGAYAGTVLTPWQASYATLKENDTNKTTKVFGK